MSENRVTISKYLEKSLTPYSSLMTDASNEANYLAPGADDQLLAIIAGIPTWSDSEDLTIIARNIQDADADTKVELIENGAAAGGDKIEFTIDGVVVGSCEILAGGITKWTLDGILDPIVYSGTPRTIAQRDALTALAGYLVYVSDGATKEYQYYDGTT